MNEKEENQINQYAEEILREAGLGFENWISDNKFQQIRTNGLIGYADVYLRHCNKDSVPNDEINIKVYTTLAELDAKLGTTASEQLFTCLLYTSRFDIIKVSFGTYNFRTRVILAWMRIMEGYFTDQLFREYDKTFFVLEKYLKANLFM